MGVCGGGLPPAAPVPLGTPGVAEAHGEPLLFEKGGPDRAGDRSPDESRAAGLARAALPAGRLRREPPRLPAVSEPELVRHYTRLARSNHSVDAGFYPLGSCTMKHNPRLGEEAAALPGFARLHPLAPEEGAQGALRLMWELGRVLAELTGMAHFSFQPAAGAQGELAGLLLVRAWQRRHGGRHRRVVLVPDSAHGTNPASAALAGYEVRTVRSGPDGCVDPDHLRTLLGGDVACLMLTNPNTLGIFERGIAEVAGLVHEAGGLLYYDGANLNAVMGVARPGDMGFDVVHLNLHKTFATPHGSGGPGGCALGVKAELEPYLPAPVVVREEGDRFRLDWDRPLSSGRLHAFYGHFGVLVRAYAYILRMGGEGLRQATMDAVLNASYLRHRLSGLLEEPYASPTLHEFVLSARRLKEETGVTALDLAKGLIDVGFHPPTVYFPLTVPEALMIEPTETETRETLDAFAAALAALVERARTDPTALRAAPVTTPLSRPDEARAARQPDLRWRPSAQG